MSRTEFAIGSQYNIAPSAHVAPSFKHVHSTYQSTDSVHLAALMSEVDRWLVALQRGIRELEERHKKRLVSASIGDTHRRELIEAVE
jgi:hypothetical protein